MLCLRLLCITFIINIASGMNLTIEGLPVDSCNSTDVHGVNKICNYTFGASELQKTLPLTCVLTRTQSQAKKSDVFDMIFGINTKKVKKKDTSKTVSYPIILEAYNKTVNCTLAKDNAMTIVVNVNYIPPPTTTSTTTTTTTEPLTMPTIESTPTQVSSTVQKPETTDPSSQTRGDDDSSMGWLKWVLVGGALLITMCIVVGCIVMHRQKKPKPADSMYANLTKDQNKSMPVPAPKTIQKPNVTQNPNAARKPNVTLDSNYSEPKDSQDMSEALYADPNRFVGDSSNYAETYVAKPSLQSDMYAEPYKSNYAEPYPSTAEGNYAELNLPNCSGKELYAKPIPKSQRRPKVEDDSNYSNVFGDQYGNTRK